MDEADPMKPDNELTIIPANAVRINISTIQLKRLYPKIVKPNLIKNNVAAALRIKYRFAIAISTGFIMRQLLLSMFLSQIEGNFPAQFPELIECIEFQPDVLHAGHFPE